MWHAYVPHTALAREASWSTRSCQATVLSERSPEAGRREENKWIVQENQNSGKQYKSNITKAKKSNTTGAMETPVSRRGSTIGPMQVILDSASMLPPPGSSIDLSSSSRSTTATTITSGAAPQLMAISELLDLAILCKGNAIRAVNLLDAPDDDSNNNRAGYSAGEGGAGADLLSEIIFAADGGAPRAGDEVVPSDGIPATMPIQGLEFSPSGFGLLVWGESYVAVARLPRVSRTTSKPEATPPPPQQQARWDGHQEQLQVRQQHASGDGHGHGREGGGKWRWTLVDMSGYAVDVMRQRIVKASWHPESDNCVTLLTVGKEEGGGAATAFVMLHVPGRERPEQVDMTGGFSICGMTCHTKHYGTHETT